MVSFCVFNELSLPFASEDKDCIVEKFNLFFKLLEEIKKKGLGTVRFSKEFKTYDILEGINFQKFVGQQSDQDFKRKIISFLINHGVVIIDSPIFKDEELDKQEYFSSHEYFYNHQAINGGLACCDIWNTIAISFNSDLQWDNDNVVIQRCNLCDDGEIEKKDITVIHSSRTSHLENHSKFFNTLEKELKLAISQESFWINREFFFPNIILFCPEVEKQISKLDKLVFQQAISLLRDVETGRKLITDFQYSGEGEIVHNNKELKKIREFSIGENKVFFEDHIKSLPNGYRIYFLQQDEQIYIGYIGKHLKTKKHK